MWAHPIQSPASQCRHRRFNSAPVLTKRGPRIFCGESYISTHMRRFSLDSSSLVLVYEFCDLLINLANGDYLQKATFHRLTSSCFSCIWFASWLLNLSCFIPLHSALYAWSVHISLCSGYYRMLNLLFCIVSVKRAAKIQPEGHFRFSTWERRSLWAADFRQK